jgi:imidazolonepropionase-like amidohydrolase
MFACTETPSAADGAAHDSSIGCLCHSPAFARLNAHLTARVSRRGFLGGVMAAAGAAALWPAPSSARIPDAPSSPLAFVNVRLFDGTSSAVRVGMRVVVDGKTIKSIEAADRPLAPGIATIDGGGRTLMPGLIDAHWHTMMAAVPINVLLTADIGYITLVAAEEAQRTLMRGFTSVRDMAGPSFSLKLAIDSGLNAGPRIWPSGAMISQTSGHGDFRFAYEIPSAPNGPLSRGDAIGGGAIADGADAVLKRAREQLMLGASQLKLAAGGGVSSNYDPLDVSQYTEAEFQAAVEAAENWGTYVAVHAYTPRAIQTALRAGVRCIEHGQLMDEATAKIIAGKDVWLSAQPFVEDGPSAFAEGSPNRIKQLQMFQGTDTAYALAKKLKLKTAWGTDILFDPKATASQGAKLAKMARWYEPAEILKTATSVNADLLAMSGPRNPYPGKLGVIAEGAWADLLMVDGDPLADIGLLAAPDKNLALIMKDGRIYKNALAGP